MAHVQKSVVTLRIGSDALIPDEITRLLGARPISTETKGEKIVSRKTGFVIASKLI
jgi:hypothetical protein